MAEAEHTPIAITLSPAQVEHVVRGSAGATAPGIAALISGALRRPDAAAAVDHRLSRSLLRGLSLLTCFGPGNEERGIVELARAAGMSASTTHRYALTLVELGLLERSPRTRGYRLPAPPPGDSPASTGS